MKGIAVLGSSGSIGQSTLEVIRSFPRHFKVIALSANSNVTVLYRQIKEFHPLFACVNDLKAADELKGLVRPGSTKILVGKEGLEHLLTDRTIDEVVLAISGSSALLPLLKAIDSGKNIALANKEALVMAGSIIMKKAKKKKIKIIPIDSEQSAIWQCLDGQDRSKLKTIYLTASGGPFRAKPRSKLKNISISRALRHPRWKMGRKISVDSATLMNKGLELLEAMYLFGAGPEKIKIVIHPEAIIHSMVEFIDGSLLAQLSVTDMRIPIQYALSYPQRLPTKLESIDLYKLGSLNFEKPDFKNFTCLKLAYRVAYTLGTTPAVFNASNEVAVEEFLKGKLAFLSIPVVIRKVLDRHSNILSPNIEDILEADAWSRREAYQIIEGLA